MNNYKIKKILCFLAFAIIILPKLVYAETEVISRNGSYDGLCYKGSNGQCSGTVDLRWYLDSDGNNVSCLSPGKCFGSHGNSGATANYEEKDMSKTLEKCKSAWAYKDGSHTSETDSMYCGEAVILQYSYQDNLASGLEIGSKEHVLAQQIALRMWASKYGNTIDDSNAKVDNGIYRKLADLIVSDRDDKIITVDDPRIQALVGGDQTSMNMVNAAINYFRAADVGGELTSSEIKYDSDKNSVSKDKIEFDSNIQNGSIESIKLEDGTVINGSIGQCSDGSSGCMSVNIEDEAVQSAIKKLCPVGSGKKSVKLIVTYQSNDAITSMKRYQSIEGNGAGCQQMITFDKNSKPDSQEIEIPCSHFKEPCTEDKDTGKCYGLKGEEIDCSKMEEVCGPCIIEDGKCYRNEEEVDCDECDICVKVGDNCFVAGNQVDCEDYPECENTCEKRGNKCYVGDKEVNCDDYPECTGICERQPGGGCTLGGEPVNCEDYEECKDFVCKKVGNQCFMGGKQVPCVYPPECEEDEPDNPGNCPIRKIDELPYDTCKNGDTEGELADPPMCSILKNTIKGAYEIDEYGDSQYCDVFCRETYSFKFMDKETVQSGRYFRHDVESKYVTISNLSTVVTAVQQCTSLIDYDKWKKSYMRANTEVRNAWNNLKNWEAWWEGGETSGDPVNIIEKGGGKSGCCHGDEHPDVGPYWFFEWLKKQYSMALFNGSTSPALGGGSFRGKDAVISSLYCDGNRDPETGACLGEMKCGTPAHEDAKTIMQVYGIDKSYVRDMHSRAITRYEAAVTDRDALINKLFNCNFFTPTEVREYYDRPSSYYASKYQTSTVSSKQQVISTTYGNILNGYYPSSELIDLRYDEQARLKQEGSASNVWFTNEISEPKEGIYNEVTKEFDDSRAGQKYKTTAKSNDPEDSTVCGGCKDPIHDSLSNVPNPAESDPDDPYGVLDAKEYGFWVCEGSLTAAKCVNASSRLKIPYNYVANLEVAKEIGYWQSTQFATEIFTGKVVQGSGGLQLPEKSWPVAISTLTGDYNIFLRFSKFGDAKRKKGTLKLEFNDDVNCAYAVVNEMTKYDCDDGYHECYDCDDPSTPQNECYPNGEGPNKNKLDLGFYFRSIDLDDVFPNSTYSPNKTLLNPNRPIGSNWNTQNAIQVINKIQDLGEGYLGGGKNPEYTITLTPSMRKQITKNNREIYKADYLTPSTLSCNQSTAICQSTWLQRDLRNILEDYNHADYYVQNDNSRNNLYVVGRNR